MARKVLTGSLSGVDLLLSAKMQLLAGPSVTHPSADALPLPQSETLRVLTTGREIVSLPMATGTFFFFF